MIKPSKIRRQPVALASAARPSRIRRDPVLRIDAKAAAKAAAISEERQIWGGVAGILLFAVAIAVAVVGISIATWFHDDPEAAARAARFDQCYNADGPNCVADGSNITVEGKKVLIAGLETPRIDNAACPEERDRGINAALQLANLLNGGKVTVGAAVHDSNGEMRQKVEVNGQDVGAAMVGAGVARDPAMGAADWCASEGDDG